ncbi:unnamed protein product [Haemonchus placei]|uniref:Golgi apparatus membrane protein TVP23 homolog n=1 Tax=Haemonchus placei TaxID=6290 RepID=A0A0N4WNH4_HAEPC|nr:unnamed protein product [Haemonchus placei]
MSFSLSSEWQELAKGAHKMKKVHHECIKKLSELSKIQASCLKTIKHQHHIMGNLKELLKKGVVENIRKGMTGVRAKLKSMESELPSQNNGFFFPLILRKNRNLSLSTQDEKYKCKTDYELFKWKVTLAIFVVVVLPYLFPWKVMDTTGNFLIVWHYCTLTIWESILKINGSRVKGWWVAHHYLSCVLSGIKDGECYQTFLTISISLTRRLHALREGHQMDITKLHTSSSHKCVVGVATKYRLAEKMSLGHDPSRGIDRFICLKFG